MNYFEFAELTELDQCLEYQPGLLIMADADYPALFYQGMRGALCVGEVTAGDGGTGRCDIMRTIDATEVVRYGHDIAGGYTDRDHCAGTGVWD